MFLVRGNEDGMGFRNWIARRLPWVPFSLVNKLTRQKKIFTSSAATEPSIPIVPKLRVSAGYRVIVPVSLSRVDGRADANPESEELTKSMERWTAVLRESVLFQDDDIVAINKPYGLPSQGGYEIGRTHLASLIKCFQGPDPNQPPTLVHRLDRETTGVMLIARSRRGAKGLHGLFQSSSRLVEKTYWAILAPTPKMAAGTIKLSLKELFHAPDGRRVGLFDNSDAPYYGKDKIKAIQPNQKRNKKKDVDPERERSADGELKSVTNFKVIASAADSVALVALQPETGRKHQIRVHCASGIECPILGDDKYGQKDNDKYVAAMDFLKSQLTGNPEAIKLHLHSRQITFPHPLHADKTITVKAPLPEHFEKSLKVFGIDVAKLEKKKK